MPGYGDGLTLPPPLHVQDMTSTALINAKNVLKNVIENVPGKRSSRVRVPKRIYEEDSLTQSSEEVFLTPDSVDDSAVLRDSVDGVKAANSLLIEPEDLEEDEERTGLSVVLPVELIPNPDPTSYLPCLVYSLPCEDAFYACCMDQVRAVMLCHVMLCHVN